MSIRLDPSTGFLDRHVGPAEAERAEMLEALGVDSLERLAEEAVPRAIRLGRPLDLPEALSEERLLGRLLRLPRGCRIRGLPLRIDGHTRRWLRGLGKLPVAFRLLESLEELAHRPHHRARFERGPSTTLGRSLTSDCSTAKRPATTASQS